MKHWACSPEPASCCLRSVALALPLPHNASEEPEQESQGAGGRGHRLVGTLGGREAGEQCWGAGPPVWETEARTGRGGGGSGRSHPLGVPATRQRWRSHSRPQRAPVAAETRRPSWQREAESV